MTDREHPPVNISIAEGDKDDTPAVADRETFEVASLIMDARTMAATSLETYTALNIPGHEESDDTKSQPDKKSVAGDRMPLTDTEAACAIDDLIERQRQAIESLKAARQLYFTDQNEFKHE